MVSPMGIGDNIEMRFGACLCLVKPNKRFLCYYLVSYEENNNNVFGFRLIQRFFH